MAELIALCLHVDRTKRRMHASLCPCAQEANQIHMSLHQHMSAMQSTMSLAADDGMMQKTQGMVQACMRSTKLPVNVMSVGCTLCGFGELYVLVSIIKRGSDEGGHGAVGHDEVLGAVALHPRDGVHQSSGRGNHGAAGLYDHSEAHLLGLLPNRVQ
jgi:hypothetical protein